MLSMQWLSRLLTVDQKRTWRNITQQCLDFLKCNSTGFCDVCYFWWNLDSSLCLLKQQFSLGGNGWKDSEEMFWSDQAHGVLFLDYLEKFATPGKYYEPLEVNVNISPRKKLFFTSTIQTHTRLLLFLVNASYTQNLALRDYHNLKNWSKICLKWRSHSWKTRSWKMFYINGVNNLESDERRVLIKNDTTCWKVKIIKKFVINGSSFFGQLHWTPKS